MVLVFSNASVRNGSTPPDRFIGIGDLTFAALALDAASDVLYVAARDSSAWGEVLVLKDASTRSGPVTPDRVMVTGDLLQDIAIDRSRKILYAMTQNAVAAYDHADTADGVLTADRVVYATPLTHGLALDEVTDTLYVTKMAYPGPSGGGVDVLANASVASQVTSPVHVEIPGASRVDLDPYRDRLYVLSGPVVTVLDHVSTATPATVTGIQLTAPEGTVLGGAAFAPDAG